MVGQCRGDGKLSEREKGCDTSARCPQGYWRRLYIIVVIPKYTDLTLAKTILGKKKSICNMKIIIIGLSILAIILLSVNSYGI